MQPIDGCHRGLSDLVEAGCRAYWMSGQRRDDEDRAGQMPTLQSAAVRKGTMILPVTRQEPSG